MKHIDIAGNELALGDTVATDVLVYKRSRLQLGEITEIGEKLVCVSYVKTNWKGEPGRKVTIGRAPGDVAKVVRP